MRYDVLMISDEKLSKDFKKYASKLIKNTNITLYSECDDIYDLIECIDLLIIDITVDNYINTFEEYFKKNINTIFLVDESNFGKYSIINEEKVYDHGTFVAGLITNSFVLNSSDIDFPRSQSKVFSVGVLSSEGANVHEIYDMLTRAPRERPDIKIWNLSLGASEPVELTRISTYSL